MVVSGNERLRWIHLRCSCEEARARSGIEDALDHLIAAGRQHISFIDSRTGSDDRVDAYRAHLARRGAPVALSVVSETESLEGGMRAAARLVEAAPETDAVLVYNDVMAVGALKALIGLHLRVPDEIAVVGIDGLEIGRVVTPELTTLSIDKKQLAAAAVTLLDKILHGAASSQPLETTLGLTLVVRDSG